MSSLFDTIVAPITGPGPAAVSVIRLSGPEAWSIGRSVFKGFPSEAQERHLYYGEFSTGDDGYGVKFEAGRSYTGEESVELSIHGSRAAMHGLLYECLNHGARAAEGGEFTQRAFLNGRIDLTEAEAVRDTIEAQTAAQMKLANLHREGALHRVVRDLTDQVTGILAAVEASVDFSEEVGEVDLDDLNPRLDSVADSIEALLERAQTARIVREGLRIAIVGPPNAGKSSLLNRLLGADRSIVTEIPGTTRDYVEEQLDIEGNYVVLIDTAGLRDSSDVVESIGIQRSRAAAAQADWIWFVYDAGQGLSAEDYLFLQQNPGALVIANKIDLGAFPKDQLGISALTGEGITLLLHKIKERFSGGPEQLPVPTQRHREHLREAKAQLADARGTLNSPRPDDLAAVSLRAAMAELGQITGETASPDMIERIFRDFCIGK